MHWPEDTPAGSTGLAEPLSLNLNACLALTSHNGIYRQESR
jgi:hypothetical protein